MHGEFSKPCVRNQLETLLDYSVENGANLMRRLRWILPPVLVAGLIVAATLNRADRLPNVKDSTGAITLPNGWRITPAGKHVKLAGDLPMKMQVLDRSNLLVLTAGYHDHSLNVIDAKRLEVTATLAVIKSWDGM